MALTDIRIRNAKAAEKAYKLSDAGGLYLLVTPAGARYWRMDYRFAGKRRTFAMGIYPLVTLSDARTRREDARGMLAKDVDPSSAKRAAKRTSKLATGNSFKAVACEWIDNQRLRLAPRYRALIHSRLEADIFPYIGARSVSDIDALELLAVIRKVEKRGVLETARRLRQICGQVFRYAIVTGRAKHDPSAELRGALQSPGRPRGHKAMPLKEMPNFLQALANYDGDARTRLALRLMILTFTRTTELRGAQWSEFENLDGSEPLWRIPAERTKMRRDHIVPLAPQAVRILAELRAITNSYVGTFVFASPSREGFMSNNTMLYALYRMGYHGRATVHGFRATASTSLNEMGFRPDVIERQLAHQEQSTVRAAYNRAEYLVERRIMMNHWAEHLDAVAGGNPSPPLIGRFARQMGGQAHGS